MIGRGGLCGKPKADVDHLLYILEAVGQYLNYSWNRDGFFFLLLFFYSAGPQRLRVSQLFFFVYSRSENSCELHPLANVLHLPLSTYCLIHPFPNASFFLCTEVLVKIDTWWITGYWKHRVTWVRSDQIRRLNSWFWVRRRWLRRMWRREKGNSWVSWDSALHSLHHMSACLLDPLHVCIVWFIIYMT